MRPLLFLLVVLFWPLSALAQDQSETERDRGFLTGLIEDNLSGIGRTVRIDGFAGALSSRATFDQLTIADAEGVWLTIRNGAISWNRSALLGGRIDDRGRATLAIDPFPADEQAILLTRRGRQQQRYFIGSSARPAQHTLLVVFLKLDRVDSHPARNPQPMLEYQAVLRG